MGRSKLDNARDRNIHLRMTSEEFDNLSEYSELLCKSKSEIIRLALDLYFKMIDDYGGEIEL